jgi:hypothetical protein
MSKASNNPANSQAFGNQHKLCSPISSRCSFDHSSITDGNFPVHFDVPTDESPTSPITTSASHSRKPRDQLSLSLAQLKLNHRSIVVRVIPAPNSGSLAITPKGLCLRGKALTLIKNEIIN